MNRVVVTSFILIISSFVVSFSNAWALSVEEAYRAIPHQRTLFNEDKAKMSLTEKEFLDEFFALTDLAVIQRVELLLWTTTHGKKGKNSKNYDNILSQLEDLNEPTNLREVHQLIIGAIKDQQSFYQEWDKQYKSLPSHPKVRSASQKLRQAYSILMRLYPQEGPHNKAALFDHLCALDFL